MSIDASPALLTLLLVTNGLSAVGAAWVTVVYSQKQQKVKRRIFARQMLHLAVADFLTSVAFIPLALWNYGGIAQPTSDDACLLGCRGVGMVTNSCMIVSVIVETKIAVGFALAQLRYTCALRWLVGRSLQFTWLVGIGFGSWTGWATSVWNGTTCGVRQGATLYSTFVMPGLTSVAFCISFLAYVVALERSNAGSRGPPETVLRAVGLRVLVYPLNFFITYGPMTVFRVLQLVSGRHLAWATWFKTYFVMLLMAQNLNGCVNALTYAYTFRGLRKMMHEQPLQLQRVCADDECDPLGLVSFHVNFDCDLAGTSILDGRLMSVP